MTNAMACAMKREAWTWYLPSHLVLAKILSSRCEPCTNAYIDGVKSERCTSKRIKGVYKFTALQTRMIMA